MPTSSVRSMAPAIVIVNGHVDGQPNPVTDLTLPGTRLRTLIWSLVLQGMREYLHVRNDLQRLYARPLTLDERRNVTAILHELLPLEEAEKNSRRTRNGGLHRRSSSRKGRDFAQFSSLSTIAEHKAERVPKNKEPTTTCAARLGLMSF